MCSTLSPTEKVGFAAAGSLLTACTAWTLGSGARRLRGFHSQLLLGAVPAALGVLLGYFVDEAAGQVHGGAAENHALARVGYV